LKAFTEIDVLPDSVDGANLSVRDAKVSSNDAWRQALRLLLVLVYGA